MQRFELFIKILEDKFKKPLPGLSSQLKMASMKRIVEGGQVKIPGNAKKAGVLVLFYPIMDQPHIVFIRRNEYPGVHSGQISFPGGAYEEADSDIVTTALRESEEEIGVDRSVVRVLGRLTDLYIPPSNFLVSPVVGYSILRPEFCPDPQEVDRILEISFNAISDSENLTEKQIEIFPGTRITAPGYFIEDQIIWGATAMILHELTDVISSVSGFHA